MLLHAVEVCVDGHVLVVSRDPHAEPAEPHYSQEELDGLVGGGTVRTTWQLPKWTGGGF
jgi:hypothetical protein